jgi:hypothetical protein
MSKPRYTQSGHALVADRIESDGTIIRHADVAAELLRSIGHPDATAHQPRR